MSGESSANRLEIAKRIKNARKKAGLTQASVAQQLNLTPQAISNYERGKNNVPAILLFKMAALYGVKEFAFLDSLPESYNLARETVGTVQYEELEYEVNLNNELADLCEFERRNIVQKKIRDLSPNEVELFLAEKMQYGSQPTKTDIPVTEAEINAVCVLLDSLSYTAVETEDLRYQSAFRRINRLIVLLQTANKIREGYNFTKEELFGVIPANAKLSENE